MTEQKTNGAPKKTVTAAPAAAAKKATAATTTTAKKATAATTTTAKKTVDATTTRAKNAYLSTRTAAGKTTERAKASAKSVASVVPSVPELPAMPKPQVSFPELPWVADAIETVQEALVSAPGVAKQAFAQVGNLAGEARKGATRTVTLVREAVGV